MTQIIAALTPRYVLMASDRRVTFVSGPRSGEVSDDETCKLVCICGRSVVGYTGVATLGGFPTVIWLAKTLSSGLVESAPIAARLIEEKAAVALGRIPKNFRRHAFVIAGWATRNGIQPPRPYALVISNFRKPNGAWSSTAADELSRHYRFLEIGEPAAVVSIGCDLARKRYKMLLRAIKAIEERALSPAASLRLLVNEIISTSSREPLVGEKVLATCIPRPTESADDVSKTTIFVHGYPDLETPSFLCFDPKSMSFDVFGPEFVCGGNHLSNFRGGSLHESRR